MAGARFTGLALLWLLALLLTIISARYFLPGMPGAFSQQAGGFLERAFELRLHLAAGSVAVLLAPLQLWSAFRNSKPHLHRLAGRIYLAAAVVSTLASFALVLHTFGGLITHIGFGLRSLIWLGTTLYGWRLAVGRNYIAHRRFMIRSAALAFAFVTLRLWLPLLTTLGIDFTTSYQMVSFLAWVPNLLFAELYLARSRPVTLRPR